MNLFLCGHPSVGKSTIGRLLAAKMERPFVDTDSLFEMHYAKEYGETLSCPAIARKWGEPFFRIREQEMILSLQASRSVVALGGGAVLLQKNVEHLRRIGKVVYLQQKLSTLLERMKERPFPSYLEGNDLEYAFSILYEKRCPIYEAAAHVQVNLAEWTEEEAVQELWEQYGK